MTRHLTEIELVDYADGVVPPARIAHLDACEPCRARAEMLVAMTRDARQHEVPEPSPLFWEHLPARVRDAVRHEEPASRGLRWHAPAWTAAALVALAAAAAVRVDAPFFRFIPPPATDARPAGTAASTVVPAPDAGGMDTLENDAEWALVRATADDLQWDSAHEAALAVQPGAADVIELELSPAEREELHRLIAREMSRRQTETGT